MTWPHSIRFSSLPPLSVTSTDAPSMKALYKAAAGPGLVLAERPEPVAGPGEVKIKVMRTGICGTDLHIESWDSWAAAAVNAPLIVGHEFCGFVVAVGDGVRDVAVGDLVSGE